MARPNILTYKGDGKLQYVDDSEFNGIAEVVLEKFATVDGPGNIYPSNGGGSYTTIGTFTDTRFQGTIGSGDITILSTNTTLYQDLTTNYGTVTDSPVHWDTTQGIMKIADDNDLNDLADEIISYMINNDGPGTYTLATSAPAGGTWQSIGSIDNVNDEGVTTTYNLYKKIAGTVPLTQSPLRIQGSSLKIMSQAEIEQITEKVRERIVSNGIGQYSFQGSAPGTGTWANKGTIIDTRPTTSPATYDGTGFVGDYTAAYAGNYIGVTPADYLGITPIDYAGSYTGVTPANYLGTTPANYLGITPAAYAGSYTGVTPANFLGVTPANYLGVTPSAYGGSYTGVTPANFLGVTPANYLGTAAANYTGTYTGTTPTLYTGLTPTNYTGNYTGTAPANYTGTYAGTATLNYTTIVTNPGPGYVATNFEAFSGSFTGPGNPVTYLGTFYDNSIFLPFLQGAYVGPTRTSYRYYIQYYSGGSQSTSTGTNPPASYVGPGYVGTRDYATFFGPPVQQSVQYSGSIPANFSGTYTGTGSFTFAGTYTGASPFGFVGPTPINYAGTYTGTAPANFLGTTPANYLGVTPSAYAGSYTGVTPANFLGVTPANYLGVTPAAYGGAYTGVTPANFLGTTPANYLGVTPAAYGGAYTSTTPANYLGVTPLTYLGSYSKVYSGTYTASFLGSIINNDSTTISTLTLWRRIA